MDGPASACRSACVPFRMCGREAVPTVRCGNAPVHIRKAGKGQQEYLIITMSDLLVTSVSASALTEGDAPIEGVVLTFAKVDLEYKPQGPDGALDVGLHFRYDIKAQKEG